MPTYFSFSSALRFNLVPFSAVVSLAAMTSFRPGLGFFPFLAGLFVVGSSVVSSGASLSPSLSDSPVSSHAGGWYSSSLPCPCESSSFSYKILLSDFLNSTGIPSVWCNYSPVVSPRGTSLAPASSGLNGAMPWLWRLEVRL